MAGRARAVPVQVTVKGRRKLVRIVRAGTSPQRLVLRAKIVLAAADGQANAQIARDLGCSVAVVRTWRGRFTVRGIPGLFDKRYTGPAGHRQVDPGQVELRVGRSSTDIEVTLGYTLTGQRRAVGFGRVLHPEITVLPAD